MEIIRSFGASHSDARSTTSNHHQLRIRESPGVGTEAFCSSRFKDVAWGAGCIEFLPAGSDHQHTTRRSADWVSIYLDLNEWDELSESHDLRFPGPVTCDRGWLLPKSNRVLGSLRALGKANRNNGEQAVTGVKLAASLLRHLCSQAAPRRRLALKPSSLKRVMEYVDDNLARAVSVQDLSDVAEISMFYFITAFENSVGQTPHQFLISRRLDRAKALLRTESHRRLIDVALDCGFSSHAHFSSLFKERYGCSPMKYRKDQPSHSLMWKNSIGSGAFAAGLDPVKGF